jgi:hypothetical protein
MNFVMHSITQPTREQFDLDARSRWEGEGGSQKLPFDCVSSKSGNGGQSRIGILGMLKRIVASCAVPLSWLVSCDGRFARDTREMFGIPCVDRNARLHKYGVGAGTAVGKCGY